jgi:hypothetical protein
VRRPNLFLIGAPKSGTTSLYEYLRGHPDVFMSPMKEPFYFAPDVVTGPRRRQLRYQADEQAYLELFAAAGDERWVGEASTGYMVSRRAASLVKEFDPAARILAMVRNPVAVVHALHGERQSHRVEDIADFGQALDADEDRRAGRRLPVGSTPLGATYVDTGHFGEQLTRWFDEFGREHVHVIVFDDFATDTAASFEGVLRFLEIDTTYRPSSFGIHNPSHQMRGGLAGGMRKSRVGRGLRRLGTLLMGEGRATRLAREVRHSRLTRSRSGREPLSPALRRRLEKEFALDVELLGEAIGRDLTGLWFGGPSAHNRSP